jgi:hypothetical protein
VVSWASAESAMIEATEALAMNVNFVFMIWVL